MAKLLIAHGGAPTAVINASLAGAVREAQKSGKTDGILGAAYGTGGILKESFLDLGSLDSSHFRLRNRTTDRWVSPASPHISPSGRQRRLNRLLLHLQR